MKILVTATQETTETLTTTEPPLHLSHKAIFMVPYEPFDGFFAGETDAIYVSLGLAQWREDDDTDDLSVKVWRKSSKRWSRQSEELPVHRAVDLCVLMTKALYQEEQLVNGNLLMRSGTFEHQKEDMLSLRLNDIPDVFYKGCKSSDIPENDRLKSHLRKLRDELNAANLD